MGDGVRAVGAEHFFPGHVVRLSRSLARAPPAPRASAWRRYAVPPPPPPPSPHEPSAAAQGKDHHRSLAPAAAEAIITPTTSSSLSAPAVAPNEHVAAIRLMMPPPPVRNMGRFVGDLASKGGIAHMIAARAINNAVVAVYLPWKLDQGE